MNERERMLLTRPEGVLGSWRETIPVRFHRTFEGKPFGKCDYCRRQLCRPGTSYIVHKLYEEGQLKQETVQCQVCRQELGGGYSQESSESLRQLWSDVPKSERLEISANPGIDRTSILTSRCILSGLALQEASVHCEYAYCEGPEIVFLIHPLMICGPCLVGLFDALSEETKDHRRRYFDRHFGLQPGLSSLEWVDIPVQHVLR